MSWLEELGSAGVDLGTPGVTEYVRGAIIASRVAQGWSTYAIERDLRANQVGTRTTLQRDMIEAERERQAGATLAPTLSVDYSSGEILGQPPPENWNGMFVHEVAVRYRTKDEDGNFVLNETTKYVKDPTALSPLDAASAALDLIEQGGVDTPTGAGEPSFDTLTAQLANTYYDTARSGRAGVAPATVAQLNEEAF